VMHRSAASLRPDPSWDTIVKLWKAVAWQPFTRRDGQYSSIYRTSQSSRCLSM